MVDFSIVIKINRIEQRVKIDIMLLIHQTQVLCKGIAYFVVYNNVCGKKNDQRFLLESNKKRSFVLISTFLTVKEKIYINKKYVLLIFLLFKNKDAQLV